MIQLISPPHSIMISMKAGSLLPDVSVSVTLYQLNRRTHYYVHVYLCIRYSWLKLMDQNTALWLWWPIYRGQQQIFWWLGICMICALPFRILRPTSWGIMTLSIELNSFLISICRRGDSANPPTRNKYCIPVILEAIEVIIIIIYHGRAYIHKSK